MVSVLVAWVVFRAATIGDAFRVITGMFHAKKLVLKTYTSWDVTFVLGILVAAIIFPNTQQILAVFKPALNFNEKSREQRASWLWVPNFQWACLLGLVFGFCICCMARPSQFLYFQF